MTDRRRVKRFIKIWTAVAGLVIILGYGAFQAAAFVQGPVLEVESPLDGSVSSESLVEIRGNAANISYLTLNGNKIFTDESGAWSESILLSKGYNAMTLEAQDRFGRTSRQTLQLIHK